MIGKNSSRTEVKEANLRAKRLAKEKEERDNKEKSVTDKKKSELHGN